MGILNIILILSVSVVLSLAETHNQANYLAPGLGGKPLASGTQLLPEESGIRAEEAVTTLDRFYRVYEDGTTEFKFVLSNGVAQYQRITNKEVNGKIIQVYEGYHSEPLPDKSYRTTYYIADENGYRRTRREFDTKPPKLPPYVPYVPKLKQL